MLFVNEDINDKLFESLINSKVTFVPLKLDNTSSLTDESNTEELLVDVKVLNLVGYDDYKNLNIEKIKELVLNELKGECNE